MIVVGGAIRRARLRLRDERGISLAELMVATFIFGLVMLVFTTTLASVQRAVVREDNLSRTNDDARLAMEQLDREIRSGNVLYDPADALTGYDPYYYVRVYTQSNAPTRQGEGTSGFSCVLWQIDDQGRLLTRSWPPNQPEAATSWRVVAEGIVNRQLSPPVPAFELVDATTSRTLRVTLRVNDELARFPTQTIEISEALTGRNTSHGYPASVCATVPS